MRCTIVREAPWSPGRFPKPGDLGSLLRRLDPTVAGYRLLLQKVVMRPNEPFLATAYLRSLDNLVSSHSTIAWMDLYSPAGFLFGDAPVLPTYLQEMVCDPDWTRGSIQAEFAVGRFGTGYSLMLASDPFNRAMARGDDRRGGTRVL